MRYALYFTPPADDPLTRSAAQWLGRDAFSGETIAIEAADAFPAGTMASLTADPRRYGFHATLKAPFELAPDRTEAELIAAFEGFCAVHPAFDIPSIVVGQLGPFFALIPAETQPPLQDFATAVVETFEPFRAALTDADIARRKPERLSETQRAYLLRWGYPYVREEFRFHMTLTGPVEPEQADAMRELASSRFAAFTNKPLQISGLALFIEPERGAPFTVHTWQPLTGA
ncbi:unnamed protein product [Ciceribacter sp. T2.26MG-112.2]|uniref:DUF1045 domain-containing protein n=1 Tax=Ciceribacter sp. T2.26MG-112.2 TaxID=3137154 RepID=UPI000E1B398B|nr:DUF1045 domain-containing protein [Ciceribacter naphthalenivorans]SSC70578.1 unnamed protein product [Ciceribacter naphthalenivorans]